MGVHPLDQTFVVQGFRIHISAFPNKQGSEHWASTFISQDNVSFLGEFTAAKPSGELCWEKNLGGTCWCLELQWLTFGGQSSQTDLSTWLQPKWWAGALNAARPAWIPPARPSKDALSPIISEPPISMLSLQFCHDLGEVLSKNWPCHFLLNAPMIVPWTYIRELHCHLAFFYDLSHPKRDSVEKYINDSMAIITYSSLFGAGFFFMGKKDGTVYPYVVDCRLWTPLRNHYLYEIGLQQYLHFHLY